MYSIDFQLFNIIQYRKILHNKKPFEIGCRWRITIRLPIKINKDEFTWGKMKIAAKR